MVCDAQLCRLATIRAYKQRGGGARAGDDGRDTLGRKNVQNETASCAGPMVRLTGPPKSGESVLLPDANWMQKGHVLGSWWLPAGGEPPRVLQLVLC